MENTSANGNTTPKDISIGDAQAALSTVASGQRKAFAPVPLPGWYWPGYAVAIGGLMAVNETRNPWIELPALLLFIGWLGLSTELLRRRNRLTARTRRMPWRLVVALIVPLVVYAVLVCPVVVLALRDDWPYPWLIIGAASAVGMLLIGPLSERLYRRAYQRWLAAQPQ